MELSEEVDQVGKERTSQRCSLPDTPLPIHAFCLALSHPQLSWTGELLAFKTVPSHVQTGFSVMDKGGHSKDPGPQGGVTGKGLEPRGSCGLGPTLQRGPGQVPGLKVMPALRTITFFFL